MLMGLPVPAQLLSPLAPKPDWKTLDAYQETITREEFVQVLSELYAPGNASAGTIQVGPESASVPTAAGAWVLRFAAAGQEKPVPRPWRPASTLPAAAQPLAGVKIALDPGHLGGEWARMEERFFQVGESKPVTEGDLTLRVATLLLPRLQALGATAQLVRAAPGPVSTERPGDLLRIDGMVTSRMSDPMLFYRQGEIRARARRVNDELKPDLTVCLHFNAEAWGDDKRPDFVPRNHLHVLINGCYSAAELRLEDDRYEMLLKLLSRTYAEERPAAEAVAASLAAATGLPPYTYTTDNARPAGASKYLWARNLLANRLYHTPVIFLEPYVMNNELVWERVQAGDYEGEIELGGLKRKSIFREYADAVAEGLAAYYRQARPAK